MEKITVFSLLLVLLSATLSAQLQDDFSDGDFTNAPEWFGNTDKFTVSNGELQLLDSEPAGSNTAYLYLPAPTSSEETTRWEAYVRLEFAPSASNFARIYLSASNANLSASQEGYYLKIGGISGSDDAVEFYRQDGNTSALLISGTPGAAGTDPVTARLAVNRSPDGQWELLADYTGGSDFQSEGTATDDTYSTGGFFGVYGQYTSTRNDAFFFDDIFINPLFEDTEPPSLLMAEALSATEVIARFNEPLDSAAAVLPENYALDNGIGQPAEALFEGTAPSEVRLTLSTPLQNTASYTLTVNNIQDIAGNTASSQSLGFTFYNIQPAAFHDVIISEIFPDPFPTVGLPEGEFVELYNRSDKVIQLAGLAVSSGGAPDGLPAYLLLPDSYVLLCDDDDAQAFEAFGPTVAIGAFPALTNGGDDILLTDTEGELIFEVSYEDNWYRDEAKEDGGYSIELIRLEGPYGCPGNWRASAAIAGGTPGQPNSVLGAATDEEPPSLIRAIAESAFELRLTFSEVMDEATLGDPSHYSLSPVIPVSEALPQPSRREVLLALNGALQPGTVYQVNAASAITDCMGNALLPGAAVHTGLTEPIEPQDVIINEVLFNPETGGSDFIELYNRSPKIVNLSGLAIANTQNGDSETINTDYLLFPDGYAVLTASPEDVATRFAVEAPEALLEATLPAMNDDDGNVTLRRAATIISEINYDESWYRDEAKTGGGYSIELIQPDGPYDCPGNWRASAAIAGGTPGQPNSVLGAPSDEEAPLLARAVAESGSELRLTFSEVMDEATLGDPSHYSLSPAIPVAEALPQPSRREVLLALNGALQPGTVYQVNTASAITDCMGNALPPGATVRTGLTEPIEPRDIIINEVLFNPETGGSDFIELYNRSPKIVNLSGLAIANTQNGDSETINTDYLLFPDGYAVLTASPEDVATRFAVEAPEALLEATLPAMNDDDGNVTLRRAATIISEINYDESWYRDEAKTGGGYSIELIQPDGPYDCPGNWRASAANAGGTPGQPNSVLGAPSDEEAPLLARAVAESEFELRLTFNEVMDEATLGDPSHYSLSPVIPVSEALPQPSRREVLLVLNGALQPGTVYQVNAAPAITDCMGNALLPGAAVQTGLAEPIEPQDIIINEVLFNPEAGGSDFIEVYNRSEKVVNLNGLAIANTQKMSGDTLGAVDVDHLLFPGEYAALTESPEDILSRFTVRFPQALVEADLPTLDDKSGNAGLRYEGRLIDAFDYSEALHYPLLDSREGVSLERISPEAPTQDEGNWHSAASTVGFATPTYQNSQFIDKSGVLDEMFTVLTPTFSPDGDGFDDVLLIDYEADQPGYNLNVHIYDSVGRLVKRLANNETLAARGSLKWDGVGEDGGRARIGIYVLWLELFMPDGTVERDKKVVVLAGRLE